MTKPKTWHELPSSIKKRFLNNVSFDYDPYEGSELEEINKALTNPDNLSKRNQEILDKAYQNLDWESLFSFCSSSLVGIKKQIEELEKFMKQ